MENISIKVHPPWYARGTPVINPRDGPPMAESENTDYVIKCRKLTLHSVCSFITISALTNFRFSIFFDMINQNWYKPLFAIRGGPSVRGNPGECMPDQQGGMNVLMREYLSDRQAGMNEVGSRKPEDRNRGNPVGKTRLWLTLKTTLFNTQNSVFSQWYAQTRRVAKIIENKICISKIRQLANEKIIDVINEWRKYHPAGVSVPSLNSYNNHNIPLGLKINIHQWFKN